MDQEEVLLDIIQGILDIQSKLIQRITALEQVQSELNCAGRAEQFGWNRKRREVFDIDG